MLTSQESGDLSDQFDLEKGCIFLNSGEYGITPKVLSDAKFRYFQLIESNSDVFFRHTLFDMINETRKIAASTLNAEEDNIVFLDNYVEAVHTALRSCCSKAGGNILIYDFLNNETKKICQFIAHYYEITCIEISTSLSILNSDENLINALIEKLEQNKISVFVVEHLSVISLLLPINQIVNVCKQRKITCIVDGNHTYGHINLDLKELNPGIDIFIIISHFKRYLYYQLQYLGVYSEISRYSSRRKSTFICLTKKIKEYHEKIDPANLSLFNHQDFKNRFKYLGTRDVSSIFTLKDEREFKSRYLKGDFPKSIFNLAKEGQKILKKTLNTESLILDARRTGAMFCIELPEGDLEKIKVLEDQLATQESIYVKVLEYSGRHYIRCCCQIINRLEDFEILAKAVLKYIN